MNEIVKVNGGQIAIAEEWANKWREFQELKARMEMQEKEVKAELLEAMEANNIKTFENDFMRITYKAPSVRKVVDTGALKEQGLYDTFTKESAVKSSVSISLKD